MSRRQVHVRLAAQKVGPSRRATVMGRAALVFPAVLVRQQVLHNNLGRTLLRGEVIEASVDAWNGVPVVIRHPERRGVHVSARDPEVLEAVGVGHLFRAAFDRHRAALTADVYIFEDRVGTVDGAAEVTNTVQSGDPAEVSTGFTGYVDDTGGTWDGEAYDIDFLEIVPDHLALLPDQTGACSVEAGCGLGVNAQAGCGCGGAGIADTSGGAAGMHVQQQGTGAGDAAAPAAGTTGTTGTTGAAEDGVLRRVLNALRRWVGADNAMSDDERREALTDALREAFGGPNVFLWPVAVYSDEGVVVFERESPDGIALFRTTFEVADDMTVTLGQEPEEVRKVITFEPVTNAAGAGTKPAESINTGGSMKEKEARITALAGRSPLKAEWLRALADNELAALEERFPEQGAGGGTAAAVEGEEEQRQEAPAAGADADAGAVAQNALEALATQVKDLAAAVNAVQQDVAAVQAATAPLAAEQQQEREGLIEALVGNARCAWSREELEGKPTEDLRKIRALLTGVNYAGRGAPRSDAANAAEPAFAPVRPYYAQAQAGKGD